MAPAKHRGQQRPSVGAKHVFRLPCRRAADVRLLTCFAPSMPQPGTIGEARMSEEWTGS